MAFLAVTRMLALLAAAAFNGASVCAVPLNAAGVPVEESSFLVQQHWPAARWVEPTPFVVAALSGLEDTLLDEPMPEGIDPADRAARMLALWMRLEAAAGPAEQGSLLELDASLRADETSPRGPVLAALASMGRADANGIVPAAQGASWDVGSVNQAVALPSRTSFDSYVAVPNAGPQPGAMTVDGLPLRSFTPMPWIGLALALLAIGWIGWRTAD